MNLPFAFFKPKKDDGKSVFITNVNIKYRGSVHSLDSMHVNRGEFELKIPFENKTGRDMLADNIVRPPLKVEEITVDMPFELVSVSPKLPVSIPYKSKVELLLKVKAPLVGYSGPLTVILSEGASGTIRVEISKMTLIHRGKSREIEGGQSILNVPKGYVLKRDVQLQAFLDLNETVSKAEANSPFSVSGTEPNLPFLVGNEASILSLYIRMPDIPYAGPLELTFS